MLLGPSLRGPLVQELIQRTWFHKRLISFPHPDRLSGLVGESPPRIELRQDASLVPVRPYPRGVTHLQVESPTRRHRREVQLPVKEPLRLADRLRNLQPREPVDRPLQRKSLRECAIGVLAKVKFLPAQVAGEAGLAVLL